MTSQLNVEWKQIIGVGWQFGSRVGPHKGTLGFRLAPDWVTLRQ